MNLETKIGLVVGFAFILVIGILISDHMWATTEPPAASLARAGDVVRQGVGMPAPVNPPIAPPATIVIAPAQQVPTRADLIAPPPPAPQPVATSVTPTAPVMPPVAPQIPVAPIPGNSGSTVAMTPQVDPLLQQIASQHHEEIVVIDPTSLKPVNPPSNLSTTLPPNPTPSAKQYVAVEGDSLSRIASKFFGNRNKATLDAIVRANPSLKDNPNRIIVGKSYVIPTPDNAIPGPTLGPTAGAAPASAGLTPPANSARPASTGGGIAMTNGAATPTTPSAPTLILPTRSSGFASYGPAVTPAGNATGNSSSAPAISANERWYTVKGTDNLWRIAKEQLGDANAWIAIRDLNKDILKGADTVRVNMKLRLPVKS